MPAAAPIALAVREGGLAAIPPGVGLGRGVGAPLAASAAGRPGGGSGGEGKRASANRALHAQARGSCLQTPQHSSQLRQSRRPPPPQTLPSSLHALLGPAIEGAARALERRAVNS